jgi:membrane-bound lytic murein transglycosylase MltF
VFRVTSIIVLLTVVLGGFPQRSAIAAQEQATETKIDDDIDFSSDETWIGDLSGMLEREQVRILVSYSKTNFFIMDGRGRGFEHDLMEEFERYLNAGKKKSEPYTSVIYIPVAFDQLLTALQAGRGDIAAAGLTITEDRARNVAFTDPYIENVDEVLVTHRGAPDFETWDEVAGVKIHVAHGTSYVEHLAKVNKDLEARGLEPLQITEAESSLQSEDLMEMVNARLIDYTVVDSHKAELWARLLPDIKLQAAVTAHEGGQIAWAVRKNSPELLVKLNQFISEDLSNRMNKVKSLYGSYFQATKWVKNPNHWTFSKRVHTLIPLFQKYAERYRVPWLLMMAQGFQESSLNPGAVSPVGAIGVMQVLPATGKDLGFPDVRPADPNIHAGIKYMRWIVDNYFKDSDLPPSERVYFALAAYNAGPNRIARLRNKAPELGLDPDRWFGNMEVVVLMHVGREPVRYVSNINKYYINYKTMQQLLAEHGKTPLDITEMQSLLNDKGYDAGTPDGVIGQRTRQAIRKYQQNHGLSETDEPSLSLMRHLRSE